VYGGGRRRYECTKRKSEEENMKMSTNPILSPRSKRKWHGPK